MTSANLSTNLQHQTARSRRQGGKHFNFFFPVFCVRNSEAAALVHNTKIGKIAMATVVDFASAFRFLAYDSIAALIAIINAPIVVYNLWRGLRLTTLSPQIRLHVATIALLTIMAPLPLPYDSALILSSELRARSRITKRNDYTTLQPTPTTSKFSSSFISAKPPLCTARRSAYRSFCWRDWRCCLHAAKLAHL